MDAKVQAARLIDISSVSRPFFWIKSANIVLISTGISSFFAMLGEFVQRDTADAATGLLFVGVLGFAAWIAWKNVDVLNALVQRYTVASLALVSLFLPLGLLMSLALLSADAANRQQVTQLIAGVYAFISIGGLSLLALLAILWLRNRRVPGIDITLREFALLMEPASGDRPYPALPAKNPTRGWIFVALGSVILLAVDSIPDSIYYTDAGIRSLPTISQFAFVFFLYARSHFAPTAEQLLAHDVRAPVLFLRSFRDDEKIAYMRGEASFVDFSLESRIAKHFSAVGPFIAIGSPKDKISAVGAARATLSDGEWQGRVVDWMGRANIIILMVGITDWIDWELRKIIELGYARKLIVAFPQLKVARFAKDKRLRSLRRNAEARLATLKAAFVGTPWEAEINALGDARTLRSLIFECDGRVTAVKARSKNRNAYQLAILIAHYLLLRSRAAAPYSPATANIPLSAATPGDIAAVPPSGFWRNLSLAAKIGVPLAATGLVVAAIYLTTGGKTERSEQPAPRAQPAPPLTSSVPTPQPAVPSAPLQQVVPIIVPPASPPAIETPPAEPAPRTSAMSHPGIGCGSSPSVAEQLICSDDELGQLHLDVDRLYRLAKDRAQYPDMIEDEQSTWTEQRNACRDRDCLIASMRARKQDLLQFIGPN